MPTTPFDDWTLSDVEEELEEEIARMNWRFMQGPVGQESLSMMTTPSRANPIDVNRAFVFGNHWQGGYGWIGPAPRPGESGYDQTMLAIEQGFTSRNAIGEVVNRHAAGVMGREPDWSMVLRRALFVTPEEQGVPSPTEERSLLETPTKVEQALIDEAEALLTDWWDKRKVHALLQRACNYVTWSSRGAVRLYIPEGLLGDAPVTAGRRTKLARATKMEDALDLIHVAVLLYNEAAIITDDRTQAQCGVVRYAYCDEDEPESVVEVAELTYLDGDHTVIRTLTEADDTGTRITLPLGKRLTLYEMRRDLLITQQVQQSQRALNLAVSMLPRNVVTGGFLERVLLNAQMPGKWVTQPNDAPDKFVPDEFVTGAGTTNFIQGTQWTDPESGKTTLASPSVQWREPVDPSATILAANEHYAEILHETDQMHVLMVSDGKIGWQSRAQARGDFESSLRLTQSEAEALGRWVLETPLALAEALTNQSGKFTKPLRASFACRIDTGPVDAQERAQNDQSYEKGTMSQETAIQRNGVTDPDAELQRILAQPGADMSLLKDRAAVYATLAAVGDAYGAAIIAGFTPEQARALAGPLMDQTQAGPMSGTAQGQSTNGSAASQTGAAKPGAAPSGADVAKTGTPQPGGGVGTGKPSPGSAPVRQPLRLGPTRIKRTTV